MARFKIFRTRLHEAFLALMEQVFLPFAQSAQLQSIPVRIKARQRFPNA
jgi:hypothetical protein